MEFSRIADKKRVRFITDAIIKNVAAGEEILDVGCGNGIIARAVGALGYRVTGIDSSAKTIEAARSSNNLPNVSFIVIPAGELAIETRKYAAIICSEVIEHLHDPAALLTILKSSLTDNGILLVTVPNGRGPRELLVTKPVQYLREKNNFTWKVVSAIKKMLGFTGTTVQSDADNLSHLQFYTYATLSQLAQSHGFKITEIKKTNFIEQVFPFSLLMKRSLAFQRFDCRLADILPLSFTSGFMSVWRKK
ncbi:MAG TPA: methyltransferase domain-containing protein [Flavitalea sp.]|nr:methyltransferase domain-containing protein [Flavitalea sp.]